MTAVSVSHDATHAPEVWLHFKKERRRNDVKWDKNMKNPDCILKVPYFTDSLTSYHRSQSFNFVWMLQIKYPHYSTFLYLRLPLVYSSNKCTVSAFMHMDYCWATALQRTAERGNKVARRVPSRTVWGHSRGKSNWLF